MQIRPIDLHDPVQAEQVWELVNAVHAADLPDNPPPLRDPLLATLRHGHPEFEVRLFGAWQDHQLAGLGILLLFTVDNQHLANFEIDVAPAYRRRGVGGALHARLIESARQAGRTTIAARAVGPVPGGPRRGAAGAAFLSGLGFHPVLTNQHRRVDLSAVDEEAERRLARACQAHAEGYQLVSWTGPAPAELVAGIAQLANWVITDAPRGEMDLRETTLDEQRLRADEQSVLGWGEHLVGAAAVHEASGEVAAVTRANVRAPGDHGSIWLTVAHRAHRGHRLGTLVKIELHQAARRAFPGIQYLLTGNADANAQMLAINDQLGYEAYEAATVYQLAI